ncbi:Hypothetical_protein [Hexamita inflata]|uniref:Hypothetical_protein n=1 Tax=Hexamita inflata TaxID=28002 RepID=A0ABP1I7A9_9EUKA
MQTQVETLIVYFCAKNFVSQYVGYILVSCSAVDRFVIQAVLHFLSFMTKSHSSLFCSTFTGRRWKQLLEALRRSPLLWRELLNQLLLHLCACSNLSEVQIRYIGGFQSILVVTQQYTSYCLGVSYEISINETEGVEYIQLCVITYQSQYFKSLKFTFYCK